MNSSVCRRHYCLRSTVKGAPRGTKCLVASSTMACRACWTMLAGCSAVTGPILTAVTSNHSCSSRSTLLLLLLPSCGVLSSVGIVAGVVRPAQHRRMQNDPGRGPGAGGAYACDAWMLLMVLAVHLAVAATAQASASGERGLREPSEDRRRALQRLATSCAERRAGRGRVSHGHEQRAVVP